MTRIKNILLDYFRSTDKILWLLFFSVSAYGAMLVYSATRTAGTSNFITQVIAIGLGYLAAFFISSMDYHLIARLWPIITVVCLGLMALTSVLGVRVEGADDKAWIMIGGVSFQPSEMVKIGFIVTFAKHLDVLRERGKLKHFGHILLLCVHMAIPVVIIHIQGDDGAALVFFFMFLAMCFGAGIQLRYFALLGGLLAAAIPLAWFKVLNYDQKMRFRILFNQTLDPLGYGFQQTQGKISIGSGKFFGRGLFQGPRVANSSVPEDHNDFIFSVAGEELGFFGCILILVLILCILLRILRMIRQNCDPLGSYMCYGFFGLIAFQTIGNIGMCLYVLPVIGITLPFFSAGGSSTACLYLGVGLMQSVFMHMDRDDDIGMLRRA